MTVRTDQAGDDPEANRLLLFDAGDLRISMASPAARAALGYGAADIEGVSFFDLAPEITPAAWTRLTRRIASRGAASLGLPHPPALPQRRDLRRGGPASDPRHRCASDVLRHHRLGLVPTAGAPSGSTPPCCAR